MSPHAAAHRLDEYLQVIRVDVSADRVGLKIDLTPGALLAENVLTTLDPNGRSGIEPDEADAYVADVLAHLALSVDEQALRLTVASRRMPMPSDVEAGMGVISIEAIAEVEALGAGPHRLEIRNDFRPDVGVYLANALVPTAREVRVTGQDRDSRQRSLTIDFEVQRTTLRWPWIAASAIALAAALWTFRPTAGRDVRS
jgi:hypothetical protein